MECTLCDTGYYIRFGTCHYRDILFEENFDSYNLGLIPLA